MKNDKLRQMKNEISDLKGYIKHLEDKFKKETDETWKKIWSLTDELKDNCPHEKATFIDRGYNYHTRCEDGHWECDFCGKMVTPKTTTKYE